MAYKIGNVVQPRSPDVDVAGRLPLVSGRDRPTFAHFSQKDAKKDLPTLKVLGWDNLDTALHLDHVAEALREKLCWPDGDDEEEWRRQWRSAFTEGHREVINTSKRLSVELASLARNIRSRKSSSPSGSCNKGKIYGLAPRSKFRSAALSGHDFSSGRCAQDVAGVCR